MPRVASPPDVREAILDAATRLMERNGYRKMTIDDLAQEAEIGRATIYGYFQNKEDVALSVVHRYNQRIHAYWREIAESDDAPTEKLRRMILYRVMFIFDVCSHYRQSLDETLSAMRPIVLQRRSEYIDIEASILTPVIEAGCHDEVFRSENPAQTARTMLTCISGLLPFNLSSAELSSRDEIERRTQNVIELIIKGLSVCQRAEN